MFKIPSSKDINEKDEIKPSSLFQSYKQKKQEQPAPVVSSKPNTNATTTGPVTVSTSKTKSSTTTAAVTVGTTKPTTSATTLKGQTSTSGSHPQAVLEPGNSTEGNSTGTKPALSNSIRVNHRQRGNPILKHIRNVPWEYAAIVPDYVIGRSNCALFLSLRYHQLHPEYLHERLKELGKGYELRVLLVLVDVKDPHHLLKSLTKICILADLTMILAFTAEEAGRYLEAYKVYENKPAEALMERADTDYVSKLTECLTTVKSVNKTDCLTLISAFKSMEGIIKASKEDISMCAGFGPQKAQRLYDVFHEPYLRLKKRERERLRNEEQDSKTSPSKKSR
ncbi:DNA excision repair protein ERCC-1-like [Mya arenaria]|uniref:DNA excision repair protein ERCC-1-like n=1 Tax=Mya arenaria TaxID=6604 RepID=UPI0022E00CE7|nr:DNA excision repair protein ERCC-1-like [Mya arenaria]